MSSEVNLVLPAGDHFHFVQFALLLPLQGAQIVILHTVRRIRWVEVISGSKRRGKLVGHNDCRAVGRADIRYLSGLSHKFAADRSPSYCYFERYFFIYALYLIACTRKSRRRDWRISYKMWINRVRRKKKIDANKLAFVSFSFFFFFSKQNTRIGVHAM